MGVGDKGGAVDGGYGYQKPGWGRMDCRPIIASLAGSRNAGLGSQNSRFKLWAIGLRRPRGRMGDGEQGGDGFGGGEHRRVKRGLPEGGVIISMCVFGWQLTLPDRFGRVKMLRKPRRVTPGPD